MQCTTQRVNSKRDLFKAVTSVNIVHDHHNPVVQPDLRGGGGAKFFEQHIPGAVVKPSGSSHNRNIEIFLPSK